MLEEITLALSTFLGPQPVYEINVDGNKASAFKTIEEAVTFAAKATEKAKAVYFVFNPIDAKARSAYIKAEKAKGRKSPRTCDAVISSRRWVVFDFDPVRGPNLPSSEAEKLEAEKVANQVIEYLNGYGWLSDPIIVDSGNGYHLYYPANIENTPETQRAIKRLTDQVSARFSTDEVIVDRTVYKAAQLMRLPGTVNRKGVESDDRPYRGVAILSKPEKQRALTLEDINKIVSPVEAKSLSTEEGNQLDVYAYAETYDLELLEVDPIDRISPEGKGYTVYPLVCPFDASHKRGESALTVGTNGAIGFSCKHHSCAGKTWEDVKELLGPPTFEHYPQPEASEEFEPVEADELDGLFDPEPKKAKGAPKIRSASTIKRREADKLRTPIVKGLFRRRDVVNIIAAPKVGKSWLSMGLALAIARGGTPWLGFETTRGRVLIVDNELESSDFDYRLNQVAKHSSIDLDSIDGYLDADNLRDDGRLMNLQEMARYFARIPFEAYDLIILDALYRFLPPRVSENDNGDMTQIYNLVAKYAAQTGAAIALVHHTSKGDQGGKSVTDVGSGAGSISRAADCHLIIRAHEVKDHAVVQCAVRTFAPEDAPEQGKPFTIAWNYPIWSRSEEAPALAVAPSKAEQRQIAKELEDLQVVIEIVKGVESGKIKESDIRKASGFSYDRTRRIVSKAIETGDIMILETVGTTKGGLQRVLAPSDIF